MLQLLLSGRKRGEILLLEKIRQPVIRDLSGVDQMIIDSLKSEVELIDQIGHYIVNAGGKRIRPLLTLLSAKACGYAGKDHIKLATVIEFIHTATLLHDDVIDKSEMRRGRLTANAKWGNQAAVLVGDFLYSRSFQLMVELESMDIMQEMAQTTNLIAQGEVLQLVNLQNTHLDRQQSMDVIRYKTAQLFAASCRSAALLVNAGEEVCTALYTYGMNLGIAYQLVDDTLDYIADETITGKSIGDDLAEGKATIPLIIAIERSDDNDKTTLQKAVNEKNTQDIETIIKIIKKTGAIEASLELGKTYIEKAKTALTPLPDGDCRQSLELLSEFVIDRKY